MKTLGIIGGIAPPSTIDYYRQLIALHRATSPDGSYPSLLINSIEAASFFRLLAAGDREPLIEVLLRGVGRLAGGGADIGLFASNAPHLVFDDVAAKSPIPLISIVEETAIVAESQGLRKVGLLGARFTMERDFYPTVFARRGISVVVPTEDDRAYVHDRYFGELVEGVFRDETRDGIVAVIDRMHANEGIQAVILGGTELSLLLRAHSAVSVPMLDTTAIHVAAAITRLLSQ